MMSDDEMSSDAFPSDPGDPIQENREIHHQRLRRRPNMVGNSNPEAPKKARLDHVLQNQHGNGNFAISNTFSELNDNVNEHELIHSPLNRPIQEQTPNHAGDTRIIKEKIPPITVSSISISDLINKVQSSLPSSVYQNNNIRYKLTQNGIKLHINTIENFKKVREFLKLKEISFYSHPLEEDKTIKFVMHGLYDMHEDELKELLSDSELFPCSISKLRIKNRRYNDQNIYMLQFKKDQNMSLERLRTIRAVNGIIVKFEKYMYDRNGITQCANCLRFSHGARNCHLPPRCIRCGEDHQSSQCNKLIVPRDPKSKIPIDKIKCANCNGKHTGNYEKCPERLKVLSARTSTRNQHKNAPSYSRGTHRQIPTLMPNHRNANTTHQNSISYAEVTRTHQGDLFSPEECYKIFKRFLNDIKRCKTKEEQIDTIAQITFNLLSNNDRP